MKKNNYLILFFGIFLIFSGFASFFIQGKTDLASIIMLISGFLITIIFIMLNSKDLLSLLLKRDVKYGANSLLMTIIFIAILVFVQIIVVDKKIQFDFTSEKIFTLSEQSTKVLNNLKNPIKVMAFTNKATEIKINDILEIYRIKSKMFSYEIIDPSTNPIKAKEYNIQVNNTLIFFNGDKKEKITEINEEKITNTLIKITREQKKKIYFTQGHGEKLLTDNNKDGISTIKNELIKQSYEVEPLIILQKKQIPDDAFIVVLDGLQKNMMKEEELALEKYIEKGGRVFILIDPDDSKQIKDFVAKYNIIVRDDIVVDKFSKMMGGDFLIPMIPNYPQHPITKGMRAATFFPLASSLDISSTGKNNILVEGLAFTSTDSWGETDRELLKKNQSKLDEKDTKGPLSIGAVSTIPSKNNESKKDEKKDKTAQVVVFGNSNFISNGNIGISGNMDLALNILNWLAEEEDLIAIKPKDKKSAPLILDQLQGKLILFACVICLPLFVIILGSFVIIRRRIKSA